MKIVMIQQQQLLQANRLILANDRALVLPLAVVAFLVLP
eukprot:SAG31_NODE_2240_length_6111_cov_11.710246_5_plen_39_part_00